MSLASDDLFATALRASAMGLDDDGLPHAFARLKDGAILELEPIDGVQMQPKKRRREWAGQALAGLSAQLRAASQRR